MGTIPAPDPGVCVCRRSGAPRPGARAPARILIGLRPDVLDIARRPAGWLWPSLAGAPLALLLLYDYLIDAFAPKPPEDCVDPPRAVCSDPRSTSRISPLTRTCALPSQTPR